MKSVDIFLDPNLRQLAAQTEKFFSQKFVYSATRNFLQIISREIS